MNTHFTTERLSLQPLKLADAGFIFQLVNTATWLQFIGDRKVGAVKDAEAYIQKILGNPAIRYWVVKLKDQEIPIGTITLIQRDYLPHPDIGFAFLPEYGKKGYAFEATNIVLHTFLEDPLFATIMATAAPDNINSIQLLEKLGLTFKEKIEVEGKTLVLYRIVANDIDQIPKL
ncbi:GNAT family N-acetyltransferase [Pedobacter sp. L105]|uniref:GNAT family N-acetyltransferase n=1 Tax=Pedobacter sp. L105 TaxID=1641871 RepID=UPI00131E4A70|nr:GNAT family N-acetyltransferase [Pedobacter sp. L105]